MKLLKTNKLAFIAAFVVGLIYVVPHVWFIISLGDNYKGIPMMPSANEVEYVYQIRDILDGNYLLGSPLYYEYKQQMPIMLPVGEYFYALPVLLFHVPLPYILIASKFFFPAILFLLIYFFVKRLVDNPSTLSGKLSSIAAGLFITLGYDIIDFRSTFRLFNGDTDVLHGFAFLWARPVNPTIGGIFLFAFLIAVCALWQHTMFRSRAVIWSAVFLMIMFGVYFFSWGIAMSILAFLTLFSLLQKNYTLFKDFIAIPLLSIIFSFPYWLVMWYAKKSPWYEESSLRHGLFLTHYPLINKLLVAVLVVYLIIAVTLHFRKNFKLELQSWHWFSLAMMFGTFFAYNQQVITGKTIWPFHFVQYSIPICIIVIILLLHNEIKPRWRILWTIPVIGIIMGTLVYGVYAQSISYPDTAEYFTKFQSYTPALNWLDHTSGDCVALVDFNTESWHDLSALVAAFTHCDMYARDWHFSLLPFQRSVDDYMIQLRWQGVQAEDIDRYITEHKDEAVGYLFSNWKLLYHVTQFPDFEDREVEKRIAAFPDEYRKFMSVDLNTVLHKYRLDYIVSVGPLKKGILKQLENSKLVFNSNGVFIYSFK